MSIQCCTVHAETIVNVTMFKCLCLTGIPPHLSFFYRYIYIHRVILLLTAHDIWLRMTSVESMFIYHMT